MEEWAVDGILLRQVLMIGSGDFDVWEAGKRKDGESGCRCVFRSGSMLAFEVALGRISLDHLLSLKRCHSWNQNSESLHQNLHVRAHNTLSKNAKIGKHDAYESISILVIMSYSWQKILVKYGTFKKGSNFRTMNIMKIPLQFSKKPTSF